MGERKIHSFSIDATTTEINLVRTRENLLKTLEDQMRDDGYCISLDIAPVPRTYYKGGDRFTMSLTVFGVFAGKNKVKEIVGFTNGNFIKRKV